MRNSTAIRAYKRIVHRNRKLFAQYYVSVLVRVAFAACLNYGLLFAANIGFLRIRTLFAIYMIVNSSEIFRMKWSWRLYIKCRNLVLRAGYRDLLNNLATVMPNELRQFNATSLSSGIIAASNVPKLVFDLTDAIVEFGGALISFIVVNAIDRSINILYIAAGFGGAALLLAYEPVEIDSSECIEDSMHTLALIVDAANHREESQTQGRIIHGYERAEELRMQNNAKTDRIFIYAYLVLLLFMFLMILNRMSPDMQMVELVLRIYSLVDLINLQDSFVKLRELLKRLSIRTQTLERFHGLPRAPPAEQIELRSGWRLHVTDIRLTNPIIEQVLPVELHAGRHILIDGASGAGKSTLLHLVAGLRSADRLRLELNGKSIENMQLITRVPPESAFLLLRSQVCYMFQDSTLPLGRVDAAVWHEDDEIRRQVVELLEIGALMNRNCSQLTTTQQCMVMLAINLSRTLRRGHPIVIMDEVERSLTDKQATLVMLRILQLLSDRCVLVVTHSEQVKGLFGAGERVLINDGSF
jgi:ABC-type lipoprotein export system ATPase subunit